MFNVHYFILFAVNYLDRTFFKYIYFCSNFVFLIEFIKQLFIFFKYYKNNIYIYLVQNFPQVYAKRFLNLPFFAEMPGRYNTQI